MMKPNARQVLVVAAHPDDEVLGAGGTIAKHTARGDAVSVIILTEGASVQFPGEPEKIELKKMQARKVARMLGIHEVFFGNFPDQQLDMQPIITVASFIEGVIEKIRPQIVYTHHFTELNRDHRTAYEATSVAVRPFSLPLVERLLCFSVDTVSDWGQGVAQYNVFSDISETLEAKLQAMRIYETEVRRPPHPRSLEALRQIAERNGVIVGLQAAEMFQLVLEVQR
ncbi:MAG: PIG-L family deacetylase [Deltaproteobacteria bacterium]|nr:PIG-L family deacetylase [Deltaproteobacteria bacterium]